MEDVTPIVPTLQPNNSRRTIVRTRSRAQSITSPAKVVSSPHKVLSDIPVELNFDSPIRSRKRGRAEMSPISKGEAELEIEDVENNKTPKKKRKVVSSANEKAATNDLVSRIFQRTASFTKTLSRSSSKVIKRSNIPLSSSNPGIIQQQQPKPKAHMDIDLLASPQLSKSFSRVELSPSISLNSNNVVSPSKATTLRPKRLRKDDPFSQLQASYSCATLPRNLRTVRPTVFTKNCSSAKFPSLIKQEEGWIIENGSSQVNILDVSTSNSNAKSIQSDFIGQIHSSSSQLGQDSGLSETDLWYTKYFASADHQNYLAVEETYGPVSISVMKHGEVVRTIIRTEKMQDKIAVPTSLILKGSGTSLLSNSHKKIMEKPRMLLKAMIPQGWNLKNLREVKDIKHVEELAMFESNEVASKFKWGVLYVKPGQTNEDAMFGNNQTSPAFQEFLETIGEVINLKGWEGYTGGLDTTKNSTGNQSVFTSFQDLNIMFHVAPMLPHDPDCKQQLERKRHLGNDVVVIVFLDTPEEEGEVGDVEPYLPTTIRTHFQHILAVVQKEPGSNDRPRYRLHVARKNDVPEFGPALPNPSVFDRSNFRSVLLSKLINGERAALKAPAFEKAISRTRAGFINYYHNEYPKKY